MVQIAYAWTAVTEWLRDSTFWSSLIPALLCVYAHTCQPIVAYAFHFWCRMHFFLSGTLSRIRFYTVIQLEKAGWLLVWISWGGKISFPNWDSVTGIIWEILSFRESPFNLWQMLPQILFSFIVNGSYNDLIVVSYVAKENSLIVKACI